MADLRNVLQELGFVQSFLQSWDLAIAGREGVDELLAQLCEEAYYVLWWRICSTARTLTMKGLCREELAFSTSSVR